MHDGKIISFPRREGDNPGRQHSLAHIQAQQLRKLFLEGGKGQLEVFQRLSCRIEMLTKDLKKKFGDRSGRMAKVFGENYVRVASRFTAVDGKPPAQLYRTPEAWLSVIDGFAAQQSMPRPTFVAEMLKFGLTGDDDTARSSDVMWLDELHKLVDAMTERLALGVDLGRTEEYIAGSGLYLEEGVVVVGQWPGSLAGYSEADVSHAFVLGLVPHVLGLNYTPIVDISLPDTEDTKALFVSSSGFRQDAVDRSTGYYLKAGTRIGAAMAIHASTKLLTFALIECQVAHMSLADEEGQILETRETSVDLQGYITDDRKDDIGTAPGSAAWALPDTWLQNSVRFNFPGSVGFERLARSLVVKPLIYNDFDENYVWRADPDEWEDFPVSSPVHTVAAAIESNLLYADVAKRGGGLECRLDQRLLGEMQRVERVVTEFRLSRNARRLDHRDVLLAGWDQKPGQE